MVAKIMQPRTEPAATNYAWLSQLRLLLCLPRGPSWQLLARHHLEARISPKDFVKKVGKTSLVALDLVVLAMVQGREPQALVGIEDNGRWQHRRLEEAFVRLFDSHVHPHPAQLGAAVAELRSELFLEAFEHVRLCGAQLPLLQVYDAKAFALEAHVLVRFRRELWDVLHKPWLGFLDGFLLLTASATALDLVTHAGLRMQVHPILQGQEIHLALVVFFDLRLRTTLHNHGRELRHLELFHDVGFCFRHETEFHSTPENRLTRKRFPDRGGRLFVREKDDLRLRGVCSHEGVNVVRSEFGGKVREETRNFGCDRLRFHLSLILEGRHGVCGVNHDRWSLFHALLHAKPAEVRAAQRGDLRHTLQVGGHLVVLVQESLILAFVVFVKPHGAHRAVAKLRDDAIKILRSDALDVVLHGLDLYFPPQGAMHQQACHEAAEAGGGDKNHFAEPLVRASAG
mmetsp:Transcript_106855/g.300421  ORF Transcript_106855/g.300421 Transcript_106855/m.300421 type:complete len:456 (-) Transcript_106855:55-1422(-)